jgi:glycosyltransferase involved in cell wall biosynthesis
MTTTVSVIICTAGKPESLRQTLQSLKQVNLPQNFECEVLVVDNRPDSSQLVVETTDLRPFNLRYVAEPQPGQTCARNTGLGKSTGDFIVFTDDDIRLPVDWIEKLTAPIVGGQADAVAGEITIAPHLLRDWMTH